MQDEYVMIIAHTYNSVTAMLQSLDWANLRERRKITRLSFFYDIIIAIWI